MVAGKDVCLRRLAKGGRAREVRFNRFLGNAKVTTDRVIESWSDGTVAAAEGRHVLAIQDTSEINFATTAKRRRGLGEIGKGNGRGVLLHPMLAVDAENGICLGLLSGQVWTRKGRRTVSHDRRDVVGQGIAALDRHRAGGQAAAGRGRDGDRARRPRERHLRRFMPARAEQHFHVIARSMHDRKLADGSGLYAASEAMAVVDQRAIVLPARAQRTERLARLELRFGAVNLARPQTKFLRHLPESLPLTLVDVREVDPAGRHRAAALAASDHPSRWRTAEQAWRIVEWYKRRWLIEQFFRVLKTQGFKLEDSQIATADRLLKLVAIAAKAAVITIQLLQARDGRGQQPVRLAFNANEVATLAALNQNLEAQEQTAQEPASARQPRLGRLDHRPPRRLGRLSILQAARSHHHETRPRILPCRRSRMEPQRCVHALARTRGRRS